MLHRAAAYCFYISSVSALYGWDRLLSKDTIIMWITAKLLFLVMMDAIEAVLAIEFAFVVFQVTHRQGLTALGADGHRFAAVALQSG